MLALCTTLFQFLVLIPRNNSYVTKRIPMPFWVAGATRLCVLCGCFVFLRSMGSGILCTSPMGKFQITIDWGDEVFGGKGLLQPVRH
jgi:hypothetical protein